MGNRNMNNTVTIHVKNIYNVEVATYKSVAVPNVGDNLTVFIGGFNGHYCNCKVLSRTFGDGWVSLDTDIAEKVLTREQREKAFQEWLDSEPDEDEY